MNPRVSAPAAFTTSVTRKMDRVDPKLIALARGGQEPSGPANDARRPPPLPTSGTHRLHRVLAELARDAPFVDADLLEEEDADLIEVDDTWLE